MPTPLPALQWEPCGSCGRRFLVTPPELRPIRFSINMGVANALTTAGDVVDSSLPNLVLPR